MATKRKAGKKKAGKRRTKRTGGSKRSARKPPERAGARRKKAVPARKKNTGSRAAPSRPAAHGTGDAIVSLAGRHVGEQYVLGARAPMSHPSWTGPWDCAEFASWCVYRTSDILFGVRPADDPVRADAYTGYWAQDASGEAAVPVAEAMRIAGAMLLRKPSSARGGHIAISDGARGTIEAHSTGRGVIRHTATGRRWDTGVLVPGIRYALSEEDLEPAPPVRVLRLTRPMMRGPQIERLQRRLAALGYHPGRPDGVFGPQTQSAVIEFQRDHALVPDGEVGPETTAALQF